MTIIDGYLPFTGELYFETVEVGPDGVFVLKSKIASLILFSLFYSLNRASASGLEPEVLHVL